MGGNVSVYTRSTMVKCIAALCVHKDVDSYIYVPTHLTKAHSCRRSLLTRHGSKSQIKTYAVASNKQPLRSAIQNSKAFRLHASIPTPCEVVEQMHYLWRDTLTGKYRKWDVGAVPHSKSIFVRNLRVSQQGCRKI